MKEKTPRLTKPASTSGEIQALFGEEHLVHLSEIMVIRKIDGTRTVGDIVARVQGGGLDEARICSLLGRMHDLGIVEWV